MSRRIRISWGKVAKRLLATACVLAVGWVINLIWYKPFSLYMFMERAFVEHSLEHPEELTEHHAFEKFAFNNYERHLNDLSPESWEHTRTQMLRNFDMLESYRPDGLTYSEQVSQEVLRFYWEMNLLLRYYDKDIYHNCIYPIDQVNGVHIAFVDFMLNTHEINNLEDAENYLARLRMGKVKLRQTRDNLLLHRSPPSFVLRKAMAQVADIVAGPSEDNLLFADFVEKVERVRRIPPEAKLELYDELRRIIENEVVPAYRELHDELRTLLEQQIQREEEYALENDEPYSPSIMRISAKRISPEGDEFQNPLGLIYYTNVAKYHMGQHLYNEEVTPEGLYGEVAEEVFRLQEELREALEGAGFKAERWQDAFERYSTQDSMRYEDSEQGLRTLLDDMRQIAMEGNRIADTLFGYQTNPLELRKMLTHRNPYTSRFFYYPSSIDDYRTARLFVNFDSLNRLPKCSLPVLMHVYGAPGYHFLKSVQHGNHRLPTFRRAIIDIEAYTQGWMFYAQRLLHEQGLYNDPDAYIGYLHWQLELAVRLMAEYNLHFLAIPRDMVVEETARLAGLPHWEAEAMVDQIAVDPGKAYAYWVGFRTLYGLRQMAQDALQDRFDAKGFHRAVLQTGPVPMQVLEKEVVRYIEEQGGVVRPEGLEEEAEKTLPQ
jgi:uncharacterized protein (DUF885 family)